MAKVQDTNNGHARRLMGCTPTRGVMGECVAHILNRCGHIVCTRIRFSGNNVGQLDVLR
jgi:hypothetical protein